MLTVADELTLSALPEPVRAIVDAKVRDAGRDALVAGGFLATPRTPADEAREDSARLRFLATHPDEMRFLHDMLGELYVNDRTGERRTGLLNPGADPLDGIRELIDQCRLQHAAEAGEGLHA
jgi:hypothetical protein